MLAIAAPLVLAGLAVPPGDPWLRIPAGNGPATGKSVVLISGDEEYRSEEALPQLARLLARQGFACTVLFAIDPGDGTICPNVTTNIPGLHLLDKADLMVIFTRFRNLPDEQMRHIADYVDSGGPIIGMRTASLAFRITDGPYSKYSWDCTEKGWEGGFGRTVLGETWVNHHGVHGKEGPRGIPAPGQEKHPILRGIAPGTIFGPTDVYTVRMPLPGDSLPIVMGEVTETLDPDSPPVAAKNNPMMPVAWTRTYTGSRGKPARVFTTTMGASLDLLHEGTRRMLVNAALWAVGLEDRIPAAADVTLVGGYRPTPFRFRSDAEWKPGKKPAELRP